jgi:hypothetical protein
MTTHTRSVSFATTSQLFLFRNDNKADTERTWYSQEDEEQFKLTMAEDIQRLRAVIAASRSRRLSKDDLVDCNGIEGYVLFSEDIRRRLHDMKSAHRHIALAAYHHFSLLEFSQELQQKSNHARQHAVTLTTL